jgi:hypothetical protein
MSTISEMFDYFPGNHGLTEETIYNYQPSSTDESVPIFSGSQDNIVPIAYVRKDARNNKGEPVTCFEGPCLILTKDGSAGLITYKDQGIFTINHHACVLKVKDSWKFDLDIEWFAHQYQSSLQQYVTSKSDNRVFSTKWFDRVEFKIPCLPVQRRQKNKKKALVNIKNRIEYTLEALKVVLEEAAVELKYEGYQTARLDDVFTLEGGNSGLTEDFIYYNQPSNAEEKLSILSGATLKANLMGYISRNAKPNGRELKIFSAPAILVVRKGLAGRMTYISRGEFTTNDDAYVLAPKQNWKAKVNLLWFVHEYQHLFFNLVTSKSDNATFNKEYALRQVLKVPDDIEFQDRFAKKVQAIECMLEKYKEIERRIDEELRYKLV